MSMMPEPPTGPTGPAEHVVPEAPCGRPNIYLHTITPGDTLFLLAQRYGTTWEAILRANPGTDPMNLMVGTVLKVPAPAFASYQIQAGDTLWLIGQRCGVDPRVLAQVNGIMDPMNLRIGMVIRIPIA